MAFRFITRSLQHGVRQTKPMILTLEGNIGAGKSTLLNILQRRLGARVIQEPVNQWQSVGGNPDVNLLDLFYKDPKRWAYTFQSFAFYSRLRMWTQVAEQHGHHESEHAPIRVYERSVFSDRHVFAMNGFKSGLISAAEWAVYEEWYQWLVKRFGSDVHGMIYMHTRPEVCLQRLRRRNRSEEVGVPLEYLQQIHDRHEEWLRGEGDGAAVAGERRVPVLELDCSEEFEADSQRQQRMEQQIREWVRTLKGPDA